MERFFVLDKFNTWYDWNLIVTAKDVTPPEPKTNYVEIDGADGSLDLSESLTGEITYKDRTVTASFWTDAGSRKDRERLMRNIRAALHGKKVKIIEPDDPDHYFYGRISIKNVNNIIPYLEFEIEATCEPWRYANEVTTHNISVGTSSLYVDVVINNNGVKTLCPEISVVTTYEPGINPDGITDEATVSITCNGISATLVNGTYKVTSVKLYQGVNIIRVMSFGANVTISYREADL